MLDGGRWFTVAMVLEVKAKTRDKHDGEARDGKENGSRVCAC